MSVCEKYKFPSLFINQFYPRKGTPAARMPKIPKDMVNNYYYFFFLRNYKKKNSIFDHPSHVLDIFLSNANLFIFKQIMYNVAMFII